jgi:hypothetical protein
LPTLSLLAAFDPVNDDVGQPRHYHFTGSGQFAFTPHIPKHREKIDYFRDANELAV